MNDYPRTITKMNNMRRHHLVDFPASVAEFSSGLLYMLCGTVGSRYAQWHSGKAITCKECLQIDAIDRKIEVSSAYGVTDNG